jgi:hypothetical protein
MDSDDWYVELARELLDNLSEFIRGSEPGEALFPLHKAYTVIKRTVDAADPDSDISKRKRELEDAQRRLADLRDGNRRRSEQQQAAETHWTQEREKMNEARDAWKGLDRNVKMGRILTALGDDALICREIHKRIEEAHPGISVYESDLVAPLNKMLAAGELEREKEPRGPNCKITAKGGYRWRWRRRTVMSPELQRLEQRLKEA